MKRNFLLFVALMVSSLLLGFFSKELLNTEELVINSMAEQLTSEQIKDFLDAKYKWRWIEYALVLLLLLVKTALIAAIIDVGCFFYNKKIKYGKLFGIVLKAEFVFLLAVLVKTSWFYFFYTDFTIEDLHYFYPLAAINIVGHEGLQPWLIYPLQVLNLFELAYCFVLAYLLAKQLQITPDKGFSIVMSSYGVSLVIWVICIMFLTLNMT